GQVDQVEAGGECDHAGQPRPLPEFAVLGAARPGACTAAPRSLDAHCPHRYEPSPVRAVAHPAVHGPSGVPAIRGGATRSSSFRLGTGDEPSVGGRCEISKAGGRRALRSPTAANPLHYCPPVGLSGAAGAAASSHSRSTSSSQRTISSLYTAPRRRTSEGGR